MAIDNNSSVFGADKPETDDSFDFSRAKKIEAGGSVCDAFEGRHHRRRVFVKRLKPEFRKSSLHLAALDKEFDIGVSFNHPALPHYLEIHGDYILMDYIEGQSLQKLILNRDSWLKSERNVFKLFKELVDVLDYLHIRRIFHADLKADNILLSGSERSAVLIDFDKSHSDWLDDTDGNPKRFGLDEDSKDFSDWDFRGLAQIALLIAEEFKPPFRKKLNGFARLANKKGVTASELKDFISKAVSEKNQKRIVFWISGVSAICLAIAFIFLWQRGNDEMPDLPEKSEIEQLPENQSESDIVVSTPGQPEKPEFKNESVEKKPVVESKEDRLKNALKRDISEQFPLMAKPHLAVIDEFLRDMQVEPIDRQQLSSSFQNANQDILSFTIEVNKFFTARHPDLSEMEVLDVLYASREYDDFYKKCKLMFREYDEVKSRSKESGGSKQ